MHVAHFYLPADRWSGAALVLDGDEARHCAQVSRHAVGDEVVVFDGAGRRARCRIAAISKHEVSLTVLEEQRVPKPAADLVLVQSLLKGEAMEWVVEKAVELAVSRIIPVVTERSVVRLSGEDGAKRRLKWERLALEACKQCGQLWLPKIEAPMTLDQALASTAELPLRLVAALSPEARELRQLTGNQAVAGAAIATGPEGDFTEGEYARLSSAGWQPLTLGGQTLRSETAAICALSILAYELRLPKE